MRDELEPVDGAGGRREAMRSRLLDSDVSEAVEA